MYLVQHQCASSEGSRGTGGHQRFYSKTQSIQCASGSTGGAMVGPRLRAHKLIAKPQLVSGGTDCSSLNPNGRGRLQSICFAGSSLRSKRLSWRPRHTFLSRKPRASMSVSKVFFTSTIDISALLVLTLSRVLFNTPIVICSILQNSPKSS
jgi:hypothetical protein